MLVEINSAVAFVRNILKQRDIDAGRLESFDESLSRLLMSHYRDHWFPDRPMKGSAYRCLRINHKMDPLISLAGSSCGLTESDLFRLLPNEFTMWVDPCVVSFRIGEDGSIGVIYGQDDCGSDDSASTCSTESDPVTTPQQQQRHRKNRHQQQQQQVTCRDQFRCYSPATSGHRLNACASTFVAS